MYLSPNLVGMITFALGKNEVYHSRAIYNVLDFLGDIGGLRDALKLIASILVGLFGSEGLKNKLLSKNFFTEP